ncbi:uncharacterized protein LOC117545882 [Tachysurus ichikawai]
MALLKDLSVEVSQIKESIRQPKVMSTQCPTHVRDQAGMQPPQSLYPTPSYMQPYDRRRGAFQWQQWLPDSRKCLACQQSGLDVYCIHCYRCGSSDHFLAGCRARGPMMYRDQSLNWTGSPPRDRE